MLDQIEPDESSADSFDAPSDDMTSEQPQITPYPFLTMHDGALREALASATACCVHLAALLSARVVAITASHTRWSAVTSVHNQHPATAADDNIHSFRSRINAVSCDIQPRVESVARGLMRLMRDLEVQ